MGRSETVLLYNYVERGTLPMGKLVEVVKRFLGQSAPTLAVPLPWLTAFAHAVQAFTAGRGEIHPARFRKVGTSTDIVPKFLKGTGFESQHDLDASLKHRASVSPGEFA